MGDMRIMSRRTLVVSSCLLAVVCTWLFVDITPAQTTVKETSKDGDMLLQVPKYITTEEDLDSWLKDHNKKVTEHKHGRPMTAEEEAEEDAHDKKVQEASRKEDNDDDEEEEEMLLQVPKYITTEEDLDSWLKD